MDNAPEILFDIDELPEQDNRQHDVETEITLELVKKMVQWDRKNKKLKDHHFRFMWDLVEGRIPFDSRAKKYAKLNLQNLLKFGFKG